MDAYEIKMFGGGVVATVVFFLAIAGIFYYINDVPVRVWKDDTIIYEGVSACVGIKSSGDTTTVKLGRGLFCLLPKAVYTGRDLRVEGSK